MRWQTHINIPQIYIYVKNTVLTSTEGTTQGDPLAMAMYGIGITSLTEFLQKPMSP